MTPEQLSMQAVIVWAAGISTIANTIMLLWNVFSGPSRQNGTKLEALSADLSSLKQKVSAVEQVQQTLPSKDDIHELEVAMVGLRGELATMVEKLSGYAGIMHRVEATVRRHEDHFLKKG